MELAKEIVKELVIVRKPGWSNRVYHPSGNGTINLVIAKRLWPYAVIK